MEDFVYSTYSIVCYALKNVQHYTLKLIKINYDVISAALYILSEVTRFIINFISVTFNVVVSVLEAFTDFLAESFNFLRAFLQLLWKFVMLLLSILDLVLKGLEQVIYFIWSGGKWTAGAFSASLENIQVLSVSIYEYLRVFFTFLFENISNGLVVCGTYSLKFVVGAFNWFTWLLFSTASLVDGAMIYFADSVKFLVDSVYYALTDIIPNTRLETYMGILMIVLFYATLVHVVTRLYSRGYTFPYPRTVNQYNVPYHGFGNEFSDDEFGMSADEENYEGSDTDSDNASLEEEEQDFSDDDEFSDEASELSVDDESDSEEENSSNDSDESLEPIDIQLPAEPQYNLRRSTTPNRQKKSAKDIEMEIEREREKQMCVVCQDNKKSVLILPCRHMCLCVECGNRIARARPLTRRICPLCRQKIRTIMNVYL